MITKNNNWKEFKLHINATAPINLSTLVDLMISVLSC